MKDEKIRDPIKEWEDAIVNRLKEVAVVITIFVFVMCWVAPVFSPIIKAYKRRKYAIFDDYEERAEKEMKPIRICLWIISILAWSFTLLSQLNYP